MADNGVQKDIFKGNTKPQIDGYAHMTLDCRAPYYSPHEAKTSAHLAKVKVEI